MLKQNFHTHTYRCGHAEDDVDDYCKLAVDLGMEVLGFSDHTPLPDGRWDTIRMELDELPGYCGAIDQARCDYPQLTVVKGMECDHNPDYTAFYREELLGRWALDYLVGSVHFFPHNGVWTGIYDGPMDVEVLASYVQWIVGAIESGLFTFIAHPDLFCAAYLPWDDHAQASARAILAAAEAADVPLEVNGYGLLKPKVDTPDGPRPKYPVARFWELAAEYKVRVVVNADAHFLDHLDGKTDEAVAMAKRYGLTFADMDPLVRKARKASDLLACEG
jgi:histidinol-phosphatase (PHP family)